MFHTAIQRRKKREDQINRLTINSIKINWTIKFDETSYYAIKALKPRMGQGDTTPYTRWTQVFTLQERFNRTITVHTVNLHRHRRQVLEQTLFAANRLRTPHSIRMNDFK
jgi:hypothetical protein